MFDVYRHGTLQDFENALLVLGDSGTPKNGIEGVKQSLALLACQERRAGVLKSMLIQGGFPMGLPFVDECDSVDQEQDPRTYGVIWMCDDSKRVRRAMRQPFDDHSKAEERAVFDNRLKRIDMLKKAGMWWF